jgi:hypothetical protein
MRKNVVQSEHAVCYDIRAFSLVRGWNELWNAPVRTAGFRDEIQNRGGVATIEISIGRDWLEHFVERNFQNMIFFVAYTILYRETGSIGN